RRARLAFCVYRYASHRALHSFPTRRSSDLCTLVGGVRAADSPAKGRPSGPLPCETGPALRRRAWRDPAPLLRGRRFGLALGDERSEEHTSELQSRENLVCRLLLEKKKKKKT